MKLFRISETGNHNQKVIFILAGWQTKLWMYWLFSKIFALNGFYCITYAYDDDIFTPNPTKTVKHLTGVRDSIIKSIKVFKKEGYKDISIFGTSLGSVIALMVASRSPEIQKVILNTTGADVAETVWGWDNVFPSFKRTLISKCLTLDKLKRLWGPIAPFNNIDDLKDKKILLYLSERDEVIPYEQGIRLAKEFNKRTYDYKLITNKIFRHLFAGFYNLLNARFYLTFLNN